MRYGSVCSGIEAATVAWHPLGWKPAFFSEIDTFPSAVLAHHYPEVKNYGDFTKLIDPAHPVHSEPPIDLLVGGTPCQAFSVAGLRAGLADPRGGLTLEFLRLARALRPKWIVWENVPGVLSQDGGRAFGAFIGGLEDLGYGWAYRVVDAQYTRVDGYPGAVPQRRRRVFVVGCAGGDFARAAAVLLEPEGVRRDSPPRRASRKGTAADAAGGVEVAACLQHRDAKGADSDTKPDHLLPIVFDTTQVTSPTNRSNPQVGGPCHPLAAGAHPPAIAFTGDSVVAAPIGAHEGSTYTHEGKGNFRMHNCVSQPPTMAVRRLTPVECERLQGFPDDYTRIAWKKKSVEECPDGGRYKALGNSMAVNCMRWIGRRIELVEAS